MTTSERAKHDVIVGVRVGMRTSCSGEAMNQSEEREGMERGGLGNHAPPRCILAPCPSLTSPPQAKHCPPLPCKFCLKIDLRAAFSDAGALLSVGGCKLSFEEDEAAFLVPA